MSFLSEILTGKLILTRRRTHQPPTRPVRARSVNPRIDQIVVSLVLWLITWLEDALLLVLHKFSGGVRDASAAIQCVRDLWPPTIPAATRQRWVVLMFLAGVVVSVVLENMARSYIDRVVGVG